MLNRLQAVFASLHARECKYVVLGGIAAVLYGVPRATFDLALDRLIALLGEVLENPANRLDVVKSFQEAVWHTADMIGEPWVDEILRDLAHDLDYYEPDPEARSEDPSYYDDRRLEQEIRSAIEKLTQGHR